MKLRILQLFSAVILIIFTLPINLFAEAVESGGFFKNSFSKSEINEARELVEKISSNPRGPFEKLQWFCLDGRVVKSGGSKCPDGNEPFQHGIWNGYTKRLHEIGFPLATVYASVSEKDYARFKFSPRSLAPRLVERFLMNNLDGWIFNRARYYRGGLQVEDESRGVYDLLSKLVETPQWYTKHYLLLREAVRLLPNAENPNTLDKLRGLASEIARRDRRFTNLKNKLHAFPEGSDATRVREFIGRGVGKAVRGRLELLSSLIDELYSSGQREQIALKAINDLQRKYFCRELDEVLSKVNGYGISEIKKAGAYSKALRVLRDIFHNRRDGKLRIMVLYTSVKLESALFEIRNSIIGNPRVSRREVVKRLKDSLEASYGTGLLSQRAYKAGMYSLEVLDEDSISLETYKKEVTYLHRVFDWSSGELHWQFSEAVDLLSMLDTTARMFVEDRIRTSPVSSFGALLALLDGDLSKNSKVKKNIFGSDGSSYIRAVNSGVARGELIQYSRGKEIVGSSRDYIAIVEDTESDLPPFAGIIAMSQGNVLSHVQLLARNLGIPLVKVGVTDLRNIRKKVGQRVVLGVSPSGSISIEENSSFWDSYFKTDPNIQEELEADTEKLDFSVSEILSLKAISGEDSGKIVGPKSAHLSELKKMFPNQVSNGLVLPFGIYKKFLSSIVMPNGKELLSWIAVKYKYLAKIKNNKLRQSELRIILAKIRRAIRSAKFPYNLQSELKSKMIKEFGSSNAGVFVRSDTNVEDLPNFSGAGLNLTVPNVSNFNLLIQAIKDVWASPFSSRAYQWRQNRMSNPEHVYAAVLLQASVPVDKSGVVVTSLLDKVNRNWLTVSVSSGVGGVVSDQFSESLEVNRRNGQIRLLSEAASTYQNSLAPEGGVIRISTANKNRLLTTKEIAQILKVSSIIEKNARNLRDTNTGNIVPGDIEFGFAQGTLMLFQVRPYSLSKKGKLLKVFSRFDSSEAFKNSKKSKISMNTLLSIAS